LLYEIGTSLNDATTLVFSRGSNSTDSADGIVVTGEADESSPGVFIVKASNVLHSESSVGVVLLIRTFDSNGGTSDSRQFSFYCSRLVDSCVSVYGDSPAAFQRFLSVEIESSDTVAKSSVAWTPVLLVPFSTGDYETLQDSMVSFSSKFVPFSDAANSTGAFEKLHLVLAFSRTLDDYPEALAEVQTIQAAVKAQDEAWTLYFAPDVLSFNCSNTDVTDLYDPSLQGTVDEYGESVRWVAGPNRQFEKMMRRVMENIPNGLVFMKEFDTVPQMDNHFGNLLEEVYKSMPFYVLGR
jgi:hypothetical protein